MEAKLTPCDLEVIWAAAQLKHCSRQVYDILSLLIKHLEDDPTAHLYRLLYQLPVKDHTEQVHYPIYQ